MPRRPAVSVRVRTIFVAVVTLGALLSLPVPTAFALSPSDPTALTQADGSGPVSSGGTTNETTLTFGADLADPDLDPVKLQIEIQPAAASFNDVPSNEESVFSAGGTHSLTVNSLAAGTYHWQARAADDTGAFSNWVLGDTFRINTPPNDPSGLEQRDLGGPLASGAVTNDTTIAFEATVTDPDNDPEALTDSLGIEVEVKPAGSANFDGTDTVSTSSEDFVAEGETAGVDDTLAPGSYHWRARTLDVHGGTSGWQNFGGTITVTDFRVNTPPNVPGSLNQQDLASSIAVGAKTNDTSITFSAAVSDPDNPGVSPSDTIAIQVELEPVGTSFDGFGTQTSPFVNNGQTAATTFIGLTPGTSYHWRAQAIDNHGGLSGWTSFGSNPESATDFRIRKADLALTQSFTPSPGKTSATTSASGAVTRTVTIDLTLSNAGPDEATAITITDALDNSILDAASATYCEGVCAVSSPFTGSLSVGTLASSGSVTFHITANVRTSPSPLFGGPLTLSNSPTVTSPTFDNNLANNSPTSPSDQIHTVPSPPTGVHTASGNTNAVVSWTAPSNTAPSNGGTTITQYRIVLTPQESQPASCTSPSTAVVIAPGATTDQFDTGVSSLTNGCVYDVTVQAENAVGLSDTAPAEETASPSADKSAKILTGTNDSQTTGNGSTSTNDLVVAKQSGSFETPTIGTLTEIFPPTTFAAAATTPDPTTFCGGLACIANELIENKLLDSTTGRYLIDIFYAKGAAVGTGKKAVYFSYIDPISFAEKKIQLDTCPTSFKTAKNAAIPACIMKLVATPAQNPALRIQLSIRADVIDPVSGVRK